MDPVRYHVLHPQQLTSIRTIWRVQMDRRAFTLQPLIAQGILHPGDNRLSCAVGGLDYYAGKMTAKTHIPCIDPMLTCLLA